MRVQNLRSRSAHFSNKQRRWSRVAWGLPEVTEHNSYLYSERLHSCWCFPFTCVTKFALVLLCYQNSLIQFPLCQAVHRESFVRLRGWSSHICVSPFSSLPDVGFRCLELTAKCVSSVNFIVSVPRAPEKKKKLQPPSRFYTEETKSVCHSGIWKCRSPDI